MKEFVHVHVVFIGRYRLYLSAHLPQHPSIANKCITLYCSIFSGGARHGVPRLGSRERRLPKENKFYAMRLN